MDCLYARKPSDRNFYEHENNYVLWLYFFTSQTLWIQGWFLLAFYNFESVLIARHSEINANCLDGHHPISNGLTLI